MPTSQPVEETLEAARTIAALARDRAAEGERERRLATDLVDAMVDAGFFRLCVPASVGGGEAHPATLVSVCEELARGDAAAGWCIAVMATAGMPAAYIPEPAAQEIFGDPRSVVGGVFAPRGRAIADGDSYRVSGRWPFSSGVDHCTWVTGGCIVEEDGSPRLLESGRPDVELTLFPRDEVEVIDTWNVSGLRATGSHDIAVAELTVPRAHATSVITRQPREDGPLYAFPPFGLLALTIAGTALGIGRSASVRAEATLLSARTFLHDAIGAAWIAAAGGRGVSIEQRAALRLAATHATAASATAVDTAYELGGGTAIYETSPLQRRFRDVHAATQHMLIGPSTWELTGRLMLGLPTDIAQL